MSNMFETSLCVVTAIFNSVPKTFCLDSQYIVLQYSHKRKLTALKSGRCGHHTVGPPVDRVCWNVGADHQTQTMHFLSPLMKHHPVTQANHFLMSMSAGSLCCKTWGLNKNTANNAC
jgi:hypothetical protein